MQDDSGYERIDVISDSGRVKNGDQSLWEPEVGEETARVVDDAPTGSQETIQREARETLAKCVPPTQTTGRRTGIVVGHIQSGKTLSYTTLCALAHDNDYRLVIVLPGMTTNLLDQTEERLNRDLSNSPLHGNWQIYSTAEEDFPQGAEMEIENALRDWDQGVSDPDTILLTVMKNRHHLDDVNNLLSSLALEGVPTLIIDDEADQASLNTEARSERDERSSINNSILSIRDYIPHHSFLQYTATPQAPLLVSLIDQLSPDFGQVLTPGDEYTGGEAFFSENSVQLLRHIPPHEAPDDVDPVADSPPSSLIDALKNFYVGATAAFIRRDDDTPENRSMMVHPDRLTDTHQAYLDWVRAIKYRWTHTLRGNRSDEDRESLIQDFRTEYDELVERGRDIDSFSVRERIPPFEEIVTELPRILNQTNVQQVNQHSDGVPWSRQYAHVLVGGEKLGRGFTVEGLTVAYMPRGRGVGNADTIQQRARWFGYKERYLGFCRVFLTPGMIDAYSQYVEHEEDMRSQIREHIESGQLLSEWKRRFLLDNGLRPTRRSVLEHGYLQSSFGGDWFVPRAPTRQPLGQQRKLVEELLDRYQFEENEGHEDRNPGHIHYTSSNIPLEEVFDQFLSELKYSDPRDTDRYLGLLLQVRAFLEENEEATCTVCEMSQGNSRERSMSQNGRLKELFQGAYPDRQGEIYPGDRHIREDGQVTIQIHHLDLFVGNTSGDPVDTDVPTIAIWIPEDLERGWVVQ